MLFSKKGKTEKKIESCFNNWLYIKVSSKILISKYYRCKTHSKASMNLWMQLNFEPVVKKTSLHNVTASSAYIIPLKTNWDIFTSPPHPVVYNLHVFPLRRTSPPYLRTDNGHFPHLHYHQPLTLSQSEESSNPSSRRHLNYAPQIVVEPTI